MAESQHWPTNTLIALGYSSLSKIVMVAFQQMLVIVPLRLNLNDPKGAYRHNDQWIHKNLLFEFNARQETFLSLKSFVLSRQ